MPGFESYPLQNAAPLTLSHTSLLASCSSLLPQVSNHFSSLYKRTDKALLTSNRNRTHAQPSDRPAMAFANPSRSICSGAPAAHHALPFLILLLLAAAAPPSATAQISDGSPNSSDSSTSNTNTTMGILLVILFVAFFLIGFVPFCVRICAARSEYSLRGGGAAGQRQSKPGLDKEIIDSFPIFLYSDVKDLNVGKRGSLECAVCIAEFEDDDALRLLPKCDHAFHPECIDAWLASHSTCPVCRANLAPSPNELGEVTEPTQSRDLDGAQNPNQSQSQDQEQTQVSIDVEEGGSGEAEVREMPKRKFRRFNSTGHSPSQPGGDLERYTLRLPVGVRRELMSRRLKRTISCVVVLPREGSSRRGGGEGSSRGRSDRNGRSDRWVFSRTPPFLSRARFTTSPKVGIEGASTPKSFLTNVRTPFDCLVKKSDGVGQTSTRPSV
ncbi:hypothetical protein Vadar_002327 [Vaccinium darrowii]|uniref:Uncharacterized protein n=1 Tax=Vaccinium darrowii TaxID=229202 RepID=A0ACB7Z168_9ERIC|nr:hypothetical protein Vadar_002327 [Vaccinium darrowii]